MSRVRAISCTALYALFTIVAASSPTICQTDSIKADSLNFEGRSAWNPRDQVLKITAPALFKGELKGRVSAIAGDTLIIEHLVPGKSNYARRESKYERVPFSEVTSCREQIGSRNNFILGTLIGAAAGFSVMTAVVLTDDEHKDFANLSRVIVGLSTAGGAVLGGVIGAFTRTEKWQEVPVGNVRLGLTPQGGATPGIRLSLKF